jgi:hypothetical protein
VNRDAFRWWIIAWTAVGLVLGFAFRATARPATLEEQRPFYAAATHLHAKGVTVTVPPILVMDSETDDEELCGPASIVPWACAWPDRIVLSWDAAAENRVTSRLLAKTSRRSRQAAMLGCYDACMDALIGDTHELVHSARFQAYMPFTPWVIGPVDYEEGLADAVSIDQACPLEHAVTGGLQGPRDVPWCKTIPAYPTYTQRVRWISAIEAGVSWPKPKARRWRLDQVSTPLSYGVSRILPGVVE